MQEQQKIIDKQQADIDAMKPENQQMKSALNILLKKNNLSGEEASSFKK